MGSLSLSTFSMTTQSTLEALSKPRSKDKKEKKKMKLAKPWPLIMLRGYSLSLSLYSPRIWFPFCFFLCPLQQECNENTKKEQMRKQDTKIDVIRKMKKNIIWNKEMFCRLCECVGVSLCVSVCLLCVVDTRNYDHFLVDECPSLFT